MSCNPAGISRMSATIAMALLGLTTVILVLLYGQSRIFATMANDGLLPPVFARIHPRLGTPWISQLIIGVGSRSGW
jgi:APA family basic amino acid/polyamine antiporter